VRTHEFKGSSFSLKREDFSPKRGIGNNGGGEHPHIPPFGRRNTTSLGEANVLKKRGCTPNSEFTGKKFFPIAEI